MSVPGRVARAFPIPGSTDRVILFSWGADTEKLRRNVARVDREGAIVWRAELPDHKADSDCFVSLAREGEGFIARTYREWVVLLNASGETERALREPATT